MDEVIQVVVRGLIGFFSLLVFARLLGKQQVGQLTLFDYILGITIGSMAASLTVDLTSTALSHWVGLATWTLAGLAMQYVTVKSRLAAKYINGEPTVVIMNGKIMEAAMKRMRYSTAELTAQLRENNVFDINQVEFAVFEVNGKLTVQKQAAYQPVTPHDLNLPVQNAGLAGDIIYNGVFIDDNLARWNINKSWVLGQLKSQGIQDVSEVALATIDRRGNLFVDKYNDNMKQDVEDYPGLH